ncbi:hypothetical protein VF_A1187 [Aliivibrio fischeri ES114]|uniref:DUF1496 domain-containing protein n=1 Tax=Aliivibrio fischeri (strain ATCC 700601 / ES114) TaxID=312309 RepID=B1WN89_ALIF1|nr:hypothetical protein VF_A1187 [Aliivibrio fischeri ES114]KLU78150.1 hypothetical protein AB192_13320 [Aliivibrio fischeri]
MKKFLIVILTFMFSIMVQASVFDTKSEEYCTSYQNCKKGELIIIPAKHVISICDMNKNVVIANGRPFVFTSVNDVYLKVIINKV